MSDTSGERRKAWVEQQIAKGFLPVYNKMTRKAFQVGRSGRPPEPDLMCRDDRTEEQIGIEVGIAYYDKNHAKRYGKRLAVGEQIPIDSPVLTGKKMCEFWLRSRALSERRQEISTLPRVVSCSRY